MPEKSSFSRIAMTVSVASGCLLAVTSLAQAHPSQMQHDHGIVEVAQGGGIFSDEERRIITDVLDIATGNTGSNDDSDKGDKKDKGNKGKGNKGKGNKGLPPGIAMKLERGGSLPPGIAKRDLPSDLTSRLPKRTDGAIRQIVGEDVVLIQKGTEVILDIIRGAAKN